MFESLLEAKDKTCEECKAQSVARLTELSEFFSGEKVRAHHPCSEREGEVVGHLCQHGSGGSRMAMAHIGDALAVCRVRL